MTSTSWLYTDLVCVCFCSFGLVYACVSVSLFTSVEIPVRDSSATCVAYFYVNLVVLIITVGFLYHIGDITAKRLRAQDK
ncbi:hypothetical protein EX30DRAFT_313820 [Ascodesmis nigricans]|uniref:Uncharacterized protein n=1 Tax=Ascodesmis nigricans TaxID=341454 RepID=A0A4S2N6W4_9PEZI|nr:hypothetical protein EX30DRAFT_313820 [Ascodesmis nigricans]